MSDVMHNFEMYQPENVEDAVNLLSDFGKDAWVIAGGKDSLDWFKDRVKTPKAVIDVSELSDLKGIKETSNGVRIGAMTTLTELENHKLIKSMFPGLALAASRVASPQIRNVGTIGGNLCQDTRCHYYRDGFPCYRAGGNTCYANTPTAMNREHTLFEASRCVAVTPSDTAPMMVALEAEMIIKNSKKEIIVQAEDFFIGPDIDITRMTVLEPGDLLIGIHIPSKWAGSTQYFEKVADRNVWDFALANVAMSAKVSGGKITDVRVACGAVQCTPRRLFDVEDLVIGETPNQELEELVARVASSGAKPLNYNHFKIPLMENLAKRSIRSLA
jgi:xanthine dehydrogenase YagS FAD-binding subunit